MHHRIIARLAGTVTILATLAAPFAAHAAPARADLRGRILLQVQSKGEAWYVDPKTGERVSLGSAAEAYGVMRSKGVGISNADIWKIRIGYRAMTGLDSDDDGLSNAMEDAIGTNRGKGDTDGDGFDDRREVVAGYNATSATDKQPTGDVAFAKANAGRIFLQVESKGEAWWVNPVDLKRYFLGSAANAFELMRAFGLGISNADLATIDREIVYATEIPKLAQVPGLEAVVPENPIGFEQAPEIAIKEKPVWNHPPMVSPTVGSGFTLVLEYKDATPQGGEIKTNDEVFGFFEGPDDRTYTLTRYVDDLAQRSRTDVSFADGTRYSEWQTVSGDLLETVMCGPFATGGATAETRCYKEVNAYEENDLASIFPSKGGNFHETAGELSFYTEERVIAGQNTQCHLVFILTMCVLDDNAALPFLVEFFTVSVTATSYTVGRPDSSYFTLPPGITLEAPPEEADAADTP